MNPVITTVLDQSWKWAKVPLSLAEIMDTSASTHGYHAASDYLSCPERSRLRHLGIRPIGVSDPLDPKLGALEIGTLLHALLAVRVTYGMAKAEAMVTPGSAIGNTIHEEDRLKVHELLLTYDREWPLVSGMKYREANWLYIGCESTVNTEIAPGCIRSARYDKVIQTSEGGRNVVYSLEHKCLPASAVLLTVDGPRKVGDIRKSTVLVGALGTNLQWARMKTPRFNGVQDVYEIKLQHGRRGVFGLTHPMLERTRGWVAASEVKPGMRLATALCVPTRGESQISDALIRVAGMLLCDGALTHTNFMYTKTSPIIRGEYRTALNLLGLKQDEDSLRGYIERFPKRPCAPYIQLRTKSPVIEELIKIGIQRVRSPEKSIPQSLMSLSKRQIGILIGAIWMGDGAAYTFNSAGKRRLRIIFASRSKIFRDQVRDLLTEIGLATSTNDSSVEYRGSRRPYYFVQVVGRVSKDRFLSLVASNFIYAPNVKAKLKKLRAAMDVGEVRQPEIEGDIVWENVESCKRVGQENVWDVEVPGCHTLIADGFVTHNSASRGGEWAMISYTPQFFVQATIWNRNKPLVAKYGPMLGVIPDVLVKTKIPSCDRYPARYVSERQMDLAVEYMTMPDRVVYPINPDGTYPHFIHTCYGGKYGRCDYVNYCLEGAVGAYEVVP